MLFSSLHFLFFFLPAFFVAYFAVKKRSHRNVILLAFSLVFYAWGEPVYVFLMILSIVFNYYFGLAIDKAFVEDRKQRAKGLLFITVYANLLIIGFFKYIDFLINILNSLAGTEIGYLNLPLPIGISFYTFQILSYVIDVYRRQVPVQRNILTLGAYNCMFPALIAGPIVRYETIAGELEERNENMTDFAAGLRRFIAGMMKKVFIANNMAYVCDTIFAALAASQGEYADPFIFGALGMWMAIFAFTMQIYFDFSGYSDMAIGMGRMMGFHYLENFNYPYIAKSVSDFWRRWHISLSSFFRDYVYIPLGGNRVPMWRWIVNIAIVWLLTGLWHGSGAETGTFIIWGLYFGTLLLAERFILSKNLLKVPVLRNVYTIIAFTFGWIIFRADNVAQIGTVLSTMFGANGAGKLIDHVALGAVGVIHIIAGVCAIIFCMPVSRKIKYWFENYRLGGLIDVAAAFALLYCIVELAIGSHNPFLYFRF
jgi:alginate O-acetyltransferase complex protein AlgI